MSDGQDKGKITKALEKDFDDLSRTEQLAWIEEWKSEMDVIAHSKLVGMPVVRHAAAVDTSDVVQAALFKVIRNWHKFRNQDNRKRFMKCSIQAIEWYLLERLEYTRRKNREKSLHSEMLDSDAQISDEDYQGQKERIDWVTTKLDVLSSEKPEIASVVLVRWGFGRSLEEIEDKTDFSESQIKKKFNEGIEWLERQAINEGIK